MGDVLAFTNNPDISVIALAMSNSQINSNQQKNQFYAHVLDLVEYDSQLNAEYWNLKDQRRADDALEHTYHSKGAKLRGKCLQINSQNKSVRAFCGQKLKKSLNTCRNANGAR